MLALDSEYTIVLVRLAVAALLGGIIGFERSYHGRPAGLRTHALVCMASSLLMLFTVFQWDLLAGAPKDTIRVDPTRMAQGIMTGIGFLGAGVIMKERLTIRGLTTATSIWMTASIGIIIGMGFYFAAGVATVFTLVILSLLGWFERELPTHTFSRLMIRCKRQDLITKQQLINIINEHRFRTGNVAYQLEHEGQTMQYSLTIFTHDTNNHEKLIETLVHNPLITEFSLTPLGGR